MWLKNSSWEHIFSLLEHNHSFVVLVQKHIVASSTFSVMYVEKKTWGNLEKKKSLWLARLACMIFTGKMKCRLSGYNYLYRLIVFSLLDFDATFTHKYIYIYIYAYIFQSVVCLRYFLNFILISSEWGEWSNIFFDVIWWNGNKIIISTTTKKKNRINLTLLKSSAFYPFLPSLSRESVYSGEQ